MNRLMMVLFIVSFVAISSFGSGDATSNSRIPFLNPGDSAVSLPETSFPVGFQTRKVSSSQHPRGGSSNNELDDANGVNFVSSLYNYWDVAVDVVISGSYAYVATQGSGMRIVDISDPGHPTETGFYDTPGTAQGICVEGSNVYVADGSSGLRIIDVSNPTNPTETGFLITPGEAKAVTVYEGYAFVADYDHGLRIINITNAANPVETGFYTHSSVMVDVSVSGNLAYVANGSSGLRILDISDPSNPTFVGYYDAVGSTSGIAVSGNYAYLAQWDSGMLILDISDPSSPTEVASYTNSSLVESVAVSGSYAYVGDWSQGLRVLDISDPLNPTETGSCSIFGNSYSVSISGAYAHVAALGGGLRIIDITDASQPVEAGYYRDFRSVKDVSVHGRYAFVADYVDGLRVIDVLDPSVPIEVGVNPTPNDAYGVVTSGDYAYVADGNDGLCILDVSEPTNPTVTGFCDTPGYAYGVFLAGGYAYIADYDQGLRIIDISDPSNPIEEGSYDTQSDASAVCVASGYAYVADGGDGLRVINILNPANPVEVGSYDTPGYARDVYVSGGYAYVADHDGGLCVIDISESSSLTEAGTYTFGSSYAMGVAVAGGYAYIACGGSGLHVLDISNLSSISEIAFYDTPGMALGVTLSAGYAYVPDSRSLQILQPDVLESNVGPLMVTLNQIDASAFSEIHSFVTVQDADGNPLSGLASSNFILTEDGVGQLPLTVHSQGGSSNISTAFVMDYSGSMSTQSISDMQSACVNFVGQFNPGDRGAVVKFAEGVYVYQTYTGGFADLTNAINSGYAYGTGSTALYDAVYEGISQTIPETNRSAVIALTDGQDNQSSHYLADAIVYAQNTGIPVFTIGLGDGINETILQQLADDTGGQYYNAPTSADLAAIYASISETLNNQYEVIYTTSNAVADGTTRAVHVEVTNNSDSGSDDGSYIAPTDVSGMALDIAEVTVASGDSVQIPVIVEEFSNVSVLELYIHYDESKLTFVGLTSEVMTGEVVNGAGGLIRLSWFSTTPLDLNDGDILLTLHVNATGLGAGESTPLTWTDSECIVADYNGTPYSGVNYLTGSVTGLVNFSISGTVDYFTGGVPVEGAVLDLTGSGTASTISDADGNFSFGSVSLGSYTLTPSLTEADHPGVNTLDAYRIQQDVEDLAPFTTGYELFASDVDGSGAVNTVDAYKIQRVVVGLDIDFAEGDWGFISSEYVIDLSNWTSAEQSLSYNPLSTTMIGQDFVGMRIGDANGTWPSAFLAAPAKLDELTGSLALSEEVVSPGEIATVELHALELANLGTAEWHIQFNHEVLTLQEIELPGLTGAMFTSTDSTINVSWFNVSTPTNCDDRILGRFQFQAPEEVGSESDLHLYNVVLGDDQGREVWTEVGDGSVTVSDLTGVNYQGAELVTDWALRPAYPNPFNASTTLSFDMKEAGEVRVQVYNILGNLVATLVDGNLPKGRYAATLNAQTWSSGTYFVVMKTNKFSKIQKIVLLK